MSADKLPLIMMIDDNEIDLFMNKKLLRVAGITDHTLSFLSAKSALDYIKVNADTPEKLPRLILLDIQMPEINGFQFLELFHSTPENVKKEMIIVMLSSTIDPHDLSRARNNEYVIDILKKPLDPFVLKDVLFAP